MWDHFTDLCDDLGGNDDLALAFGPLKYIYLQRLDRVGQAISRHRAEVSGTWHLGFEEAREPRVATYDFDAILAYLKEAEADHARWQGWFAQKGIVPLALTYEMLSLDPQGTATTVLAYLGLTATGPFAVSNRKMADATSADWALRFRAEMG
jgi:LPS sulfotransferase NodH